MKTGRLGGDYLPIFLLRRSDVELQLGYPDRAEADAARALSLLQASASWEHSRIRWVAPT